MQTKIEDLLKEAKSRYLPGCYFINAKTRNIEYIGFVRDTNTYFERFHHDDYEINDLGIIPNNGSGMIYWNGWWAELCDKNGNILNPIETELDIVRRIIYED